MELEFIGAAQEVTGSCHVLRAGGRTVMLDCGLFQGRRSESRDKNLELPVPVGDIDAIVLSHAHIDHAGRLPYLVRKGYRNSIFATPATHDLSAIMLADSAHIQQKDAEFLAKRQREYVEPFYEQPDVAHALGLFVGVSYDKPFDVVPGVKARFIEAGHILGSASVALDIEEGGRQFRLVFSGDIGRAGLPIIRDPVAPDGADAVIMESTYGDRDHPPAADMRERLATIVKDAAARGGRVLVPAFAVGRTQEIVYDLHALARDKKIPPIPIYIDSPLAIDATSVFAMHPDMYDAREDLVAAVRELFRFDLVQYTRDASESKLLNSQHGPMVIIAASGMAETGRILHHLMHGASDPRNTVLIVGFQAEHTLGRRIVERQPMLRIFGEQVPLRAKVEILNGYSAHADRRELAAWIDAVRSASRRSPPVWLVHGERESQHALAGTLREHGYTVDAPAPRTRVTL